MSLFDGGVTNVFALCIINGWLKKLTMQKISWNSGQKLGVVPLCGQSYPYF